MENALSTLSTPWTARYIQCYSSTSMERIPSLYLLDVLTIKKVTPEFFEGARMEAERELALWSIGNLRGYTEIISSCG
jgi:hypothetical protein